MAFNSFWKHVLERDWQWINMVKAPKVKSLPDILTVAEVEQLIGATRKLRYRTFLLATYSMGLRLGETLALQVGDIDGQRKQIHIRRGKGHKDRFVPLPDLTYQALRALWCKHRNPCWLFPNAVGSPERIRSAISHMDRGGRPDRHESGRDRGAGLKKSLDPLSAPQFRHPSA